MIDIKPFKAFLEAFDWMLALGKKDTEHIRTEISDLLQHSSRSLKSLLELRDVLEKFLRINSTGKILAYPSSLPRVLYIARGCKASA